MESKKTTLVQKTVLGCSYNPRFALDEDCLPPEFTPQVLLDDDFVQFIDTTNPLANSSSKVCGVEEAKLPQAALVNFAIDNIPTGTSADSTAPHGIFGDSQETPPDTTTPPQESISKRYPFTRFLFGPGAQKGKKREDKNQNKAPTPTPRGKSGQPETEQVDTGTSRLERLLTEAAEEAIAKMRKPYFTSEPSCSKTVVAQPNLVVQPNKKTPTPTKSDAVQWTLARVLIPVQILIQIQVRKHLLVTSY